MKIGMIVGREKVEGVVRVVAADGRTTQVTKREKKMSKKQREKEAKRKKREAERKSLMRVMREVAEELEK